MEEQSRASLVRRSKKVFPASEPGITNLTNLQAPTDGTERARTVGAPDGLAIAHHHARSVRISAASPAARIWLIN